MSIYRESNQGARAFRRVWTLRPWTAHIWSYTVSLPMEAPDPSHTGRNYSSSIESDNTMQKTSLPSPPLLSPEETKRLYRKVDVRLIPILALMYLFSGVDRGV